MVAILVKPFRCSKCNKLLGMIEGKAEIKCPKCKTVNVTRELYESYIKSPCGGPKSGAMIPIGIRIGKNE